MKDMQVSNYQQYFDTDVLNCWKISSRVNILYIVYDIEGERFVKNFY